MDELSTLGTGPGTAADTQNSASKTTCKIDDKNQIKMIYILTAISRTPGGHVWETTAGVQFGLENLELFDPVAREHTGYCTCKNRDHTTANRT
jgi:hypothetical protein